MSTLLLVQEALTVHRHTCLSEFFAELKAGNYESSYAYYQSFEDLTDVLDTMLTQTIKLAEHNHDAADFAVNPGGQRNFMNRLPKDKSERYATFLKMVMPLSEYDEPNSADGQSAAND